MPGKAIKFKVSGPYKIPYGILSHGKGKTIKKIHAKEFWDGEPGDFATKHGCYVFAISVARGHTPYYVGKTRNNMKQECFTDGKILKYRDVISDRKGAPVMFFITRNDGRNKIPKEILADVEKTLIQAAKLKNSDLLNTQHTKNIPTWSIGGVIRSGKGESSATSGKFKKMMGL